MDITTPPTCTQSVCTAGPGVAKPVADGSYGTAMNALARHSSGSTINLTWDVATCSSTDHHVLYGALAKRGILDGQRRVLQSRDHGERVVDRRAGRQPLVRRRRRQRRGVGGQLGHEDRRGARRHERFRHVRDDDEGQLGNLPVSGVAP